MGQRRADDSGSAAPDKELAGPTGRTLLRCEIDRGGCAGCGHGEFACRSIIGDELAGTWELTATERGWFDDREGHHCLHCGMSRRVRMLVWSLRAACGDLANLRVLHLNQVNQLQQVLQSATDVQETIYRPELSRGSDFGGKSNQDLEALTYSDREFDLVLHSETVEHVFDYGRALDEGLRVLRPGGFQIYTVPILHGRRTRRRAQRDERSGEVIHLLPPSAHGCAGEDLVVWEFGSDFFSRRGEHIYRVFYDDYFDNPTVFAVVERNAAP